MAKQGRSRKPRHGDGDRINPHERPEVPVVPADRVEVVVEDPDPTAALNLVERQALEIRARANAAVRRLLTAPTPKERQRLERLPPELAQWGLSPLPYTVKSLYAVLGNLFFFSDLFAQTFSTLVNLTTRPITSRQGPPLSPERLRRLSTQTVEIPAHRLHVRGSSETVLIPAQRSHSEREVETADDKTRIGLSKAARKQVTDLLKGSSVPLRKREADRTFLAVTDLMESGISQGEAIRRVAAFTNRSRAAVKAQMLRVKRRSR